MKKIVKYLLITLFIFLVSITGVNAIDPDLALDKVKKSQEENKKLTYADLEDVSLKDNDYEINCVYENGTNLIISRGDATIANQSISSSRNSRLNFSFYITPAQSNKKNTDGTITYNHDKILSKGHCPNILYAYSVEENDDTTYGKIRNYYYSTDSSIATQIKAKGLKTSRTFFWETIGYALEDAREGNLDTNLVSEQVFITTNKNYITCDYKSITSNKQALYVYMFKNMTFMQKNGYITSLNEAWTDCKKDNFYINDPTAKQVGGGNLTLGSTYYNATIYEIFDSNRTCKVSNGNNECIGYQFIGTRDNNGNKIDEKISVCDVVGNDTIEIIQRILTILQIIVPILVIILTALDIGRLVATGNLDEVLPKKKKIIIVRFIVLVIFLFAPLLSKLLITLLNDTGVITIGDIDCIFK